MGWCYDTSQLSSSGEGCVSFCGSGAECAVLITSKRIKISELLNWNSKCPSRALLAGQSEAEAQAQWIFEFL